MESLTQMTQVFAEVCRPNENKDQELIVIGNFGPGDHASEIVLKGARLPPHGSSAGSTSGSSPT